MKDIEVSDSVRMLDGSYMSIDDYNERKEDKKDAFVDFGDVVEISDDELAF